MLPLHLNVMYDDKIRNKMEEHTACQKLIYVETLERAKRQMVNGSIRVLKDLEEVLRLLDPKDSSHVRLQREIEILTNICVQMHRSFDYLNKILIAEPNLTESVDGPERDTGDTERYVLTQRRGER